MARKDKMPKGGQDPGFKPVRVTPRTDNQRDYIRTVIDNDITFVAGPAGTGKTHIAIGLAVQMLRGDFIERIIVTRPLVSVGKDMGFLPGDIGEKVGPYIQPCFDELNYYLSFSMMTQLIREKRIEIVPLSMMRGRTFNRSFIILDEAQNAERVEVKTLLTRIGADSKMVIAGDLRQSDLYADQQGAFKDAMDRLQGIEGIGISLLGPEDIVRHRLISTILERLW